MFNSSIKTCAFTGHRPCKMPWGQDENSPEGVLFKFRLLESLEYLIGRGYVNFLSGGAQGFDMMAAEMVLSLRETYPWIKLTMVCPWNGQADRWPEDQQQRWRHILEESDRVIYTSGAYDKGVFFHRNRYLVENANLILAAYNGDPHSGTGMTIHYAHRMGVKVLLLRLEKDAA